MERTLGRSLIFTGLFLTLVGLAFLLAPRIPWIGRLPGDLRISRGPVTVFFPLVTCVIVSLFLTLLMNLFRNR
jgi:hypothetical protein